jgi:hypothetical protein
MALLRVSSSSGEDIQSIIKYDAKAGRFSRIDRVDGASRPFDITNNFCAVFDFENVEVGTIRFSANAAPDFCLVPYGQAPPPAPTADHKDGFRILLKLHPSIGGDVREFAATAKSVLNGINDLHDQYLRGTAANPGLLPIVQLQNVEAVTTPGPQGKPPSTNYQPHFVIIGWCPRPADLVAKPRGLGAYGGVAITAPPATGGTRVGAPIGVAAPAPVPVAAVAAAAAFNAPAPQPVQQAYAPPQPAPVAAGDFG